MYNWSDLGPQGALVFVWAHGGQAPEEVTLGLAFFSLTLAAAAWPAELPAHPQLQPHRLAQGWPVLALTTKTPRSQGVSPASRGTLQDGDGSRAPSPAVPQPAGNAPCRSNWEAAAKEGQELSLPQGFSSPLAFLTRASQLFLSLSPGRMTACLQKRHSTAFLD